MSATAIHGDKSQQERMAALEAFKKGEIDVLVATDVAARGLDISDLPCVINFDLPYNAEDYVHRIGRTGRAGASGDAISIYSDKDERLLADIEKLIKQSIKRGELTGFNPAPARASDSERRPPRRAESGDVRPARSSDSRHGGDADTRSSSRPADRASRPFSPGPRRDKVDPWFLKPYEPTKAAPVAAVNPPASKPKQKLAALLGGLSK